MKMNNKKKNFIFWLIGLGCGFILSGIVVMLCLLQVEEYRNSLWKVQDQVGQEQSIQEITRKTSLPQTSPENVVTDVPEEINKIVSSKEEDAELNTSEIEEENDMIKISIPRNLSASQTCEILENEGVVGDGKALTEYIKAEEKTTKLRSGNFIFEENMSYEEILDILLRK